MVVTDNDTCKIKVLETIRAPFARTLEREVNALTAERDQLRAEVERLRAGIEECLHTNAHLADGEDCTLIGLKRCLRDSRVERSDAEQVDALASWANTCMHHNDAERGRCWRVCPVCITAERDQLRAENATFRAAQKACEAMDDYAAIKDLQRELAELK